MNRSGIIIATMMLCVAYFSIPPQAVADGYLLWIVPVEAFLFGSIVLIGHRVRPWWNIVAGAAFLSIANVFINIYSPILILIGSAAGTLGFSETASTNIAWFIYCGIGGILICFTLDLLDRSSHISWISYLLCFSFPMFSALAITHSEQLWIPLHKTLWFSLMVAALLASDFIYRHRAQKGFNRKPKSPGPTKPGDLSGDAS